MKVKILFLVLIGVALGSPVFALGNLIKTDDNPAVFYLDSNNVRHLFPTRNTYMSWYDNFSGVSSLDREKISQYSMGKNITVRPGISIVQFATDVNYYAIEPGGVLRPFENQVVIEDIYGSNWRQRLIKLPIGFFDDYILGKKIENIRDLPDGLIYKYAGDGKYYYKKNNIIRPFKNWDSARENRFKLIDVAVSDVPFNIRRREINGFDPYVFNPIEKPLIGNADCENKKLKAAIIFAVADSYTPEQIAKLSQIKKRVAENFSWATRETADLDLDFPIVILKDDSWITYVDENGQKQIDNEIINTFYDDNPDIFDFIILYNNFVADEPVTASYSTWTNDFLGTGNAVVHMANLLGSHGKLKGVANMGNIAKYSVENEKALNASVNYILHEIAHHWSGRARYKDDNGRIRYDLLNRENNEHWSKYVDFISPLGGNGWQDNGDGTYTSEVILTDNNGKKQYANLDLYFMGLLPKAFVGSVKYLAPDNPNEAGNVIAGQIKEVDIEQIEKAMGKWRCRL